MTVRHAAIPLVALLLAACVADGPPRPRQPSGVRPAKLVPTASVEFVDTDANRFRDSATVVVYIMGDNPSYHLPIKTAGEFELSLEGARGQTIATWNFDKDKTAGAMASLQPGPGFVFGLDLRESSANSDQIQTREADLVVSFTPEKGERIRARTSAPMLIGPIGQGRR